MNNHNIGIFDSGFGGLNILKYIVKELPEYNYIYLGDTARAPYGARSKDIIYNFTEQAVDFLFNKKCEIIILACNTASSDALRRIQQNYLKKNYPDKKVLGVIIPTVEQAIEITKNNKIGLIATEATVASGAFDREIKKLNFKIKIFQQSCPLLVPIIEAGEYKNKFLNIILEKYLSHLLKQKIDTLILGCTHYGIIKNRIKKIINNNINIISEGEIVAKKLKDYLKRHSEIDSLLTKNSKKTFYSSDITNNFKKLGSNFFGENIKPKIAIL